MRLHLYRRRHIIGFHVSLHDHFGNSKQDGVNTTEKEESKQEKLIYIPLLRPTIPAIGRMSHEIFHPHLPEILFRIARATKNLTTVPHSAAFIPDNAIIASGV